MARSATLLGVTRLDDRTTPVVGAFEIPAAVGPGLGFDGVVEFGMGDSSIGCSGVVVGDGRYVLTAAHCVDVNADGAPDADRYTVRFDLAAGPVSVVVPRANVRINPGWSNTANIEDGFDLAVLTLPVLAPRGGQIAAPLFTTFDEVGRAFQFYGYGYVGTGTTGEAVVAAGNPNAGDSAEVQRFRIAGTGTFTLDFDGQSSAPLDAAATPSQIAAALEEFSGVNHVAVYGVGSPGNPNAGAVEVVFEDVDPAMFGGTVNVPQVGLTPVTGTFTDLTAVTLIDGGVPDARRVGANTVLRTQPGGVFTATFPSVAGAAVLGAGDSGGPAFIDGKVAGIASFGDVPTVFGQTAGWARVSVFVDSFITPAVTARVPLVLDLTTQPDGADGSPDDVRVFQENYRLVVTVNGVRYFDAPLGQVSGVAIVGSADAETVRIDGVFAIPVVTDSAVETVVRSASNLVAVAVGPGVGVIDPGSATAVAALPPIDPGFTGDVTVATGDVTGDGVPDFVAAAGVGGGPVVVVFDGATRQEVRRFFAFDPDFRGGVSVAVGDVTGDGIPDIVAGAGVGGGPRVVVFDGRTGTEVRSFFAFDPGFSGGVTVAVADVTGDGVADIVTGAGAGGGPHVKAFDGATGGEVRSFFAFDPGFLGGVRVAVGDANGDGVADVFAAAGPGGGPVVRAFDGRTAAELAAFFAFDDSSRAGVAVGFAADAVTGSAAVVASSPAGVRLFTVGPDGVGGGRDVAGIG